MKHRVLPIALWKRKEDRKKAKFIRGDVVIVSYRKSKFCGCLGVILGFFDSTGYSVEFSSDRDIEFFNGKYLRRIGLTTKDVFIYRMFGFDEAMKNIQERITKEKIWKI